MKSKKSFAVLIFIAISLIVIISAALVMFERRGRTEKIPAIETVRILGLDFINEDVTLIAHRGLSAQAPENTLQAIEKAGQAGFKRVELDIRQTADGIWVLSHNDKLEKMTNGKGKITQLTYREILDFILDNGANIEQYDNIRIPDLNAALLTCMTHNVMPVIEIKSYKTGGIEKLYNMLQEKCLLKSVAVISFDRQALVEFHSLSPQTELWLLTKALDYNAQAFASEYPEIGISFKGNNKSNTQEAIKSLKKKGISLAAYTINDEALFKRLYDLGIRIFTTDVFTP